MYDLQKNEETRLTQDGYYYDNPKICGDMVVWNKVKGRSGGLFSYDISTQKETEVLEYNSGLDYVGDFNFDGNNIAYSQYDNSEDSNIYMISLSNRYDVRIVILVIIAAIVVGGVVLLALLSRKAAQGGRQSFRGEPKNEQEKNAEKSINKN